MIYVFDGYELDTRLYELRRAGQSLPLEPKVFDLLAYLIEHRDRIVGKQELFDHLWPDQFISDTTFDHCVMTARKAIGDDGRRQAIIKTIRRRGYRFVADLDEPRRHEASNSVPSPVLPAETQSPTRDADQVACPHCQQQQPPQARFCSGCGSPLWVICRQCHGENLPGGKFCSACGHTLNHATPALAGAQTPMPVCYTPRHLAHEILTSRSALEGENKQVTVLFCDIDDSMVLAERLGPEGMHTLLNRFFELALETVHRYGGIINQFLGDGFMALFGAPVAHEDHARRAVLSALELQGCLHAHRSDFERLQERLTHAPPLAVRVCMGLNTGTVVVGSIGDNLRMDYTAVGDTTNLAARLQQFAEPGTILCSEATTKLVPEEVDVEAMGPIAVRGRVEPVPVYKVVGRGARRPLLGTRPIRVLSRFVGRDRELQTLQTVLAQVERGQGQVAGIVGEPGVGKSRLLYEFRQSLADKPVLYLEGRCAAYGNITPYAPVLDMLRYHCGITETDASETAVEHVRLRLQQAGLQPDADDAYLPQLLGVKAATEHLAELNSETIKSGIVDTLCRIMLRGSQQQPLIVLIEDLHWIDQSSEDFLSALVERLSSASILLLTTYRPGYQPAWMGRSYVTQIALGQLPPSDSLRIVYSVLKQEVLPHALAQAILTRADGNPLFLEELARAIMERPDLRSASTVPDTIQGVLAARIDRLPDTVKRLLQTASVLGRTFSEPLLRALCEAPVGLKSGLQTLKQLEFLYEERPSDTDALYMFKHALTQEVVYDSLLTSRRQHLHAAAGEALEQLYADRLDEVYDRLAYHFARADRPEQAVTYLSRLAEQAAGDHAHMEAVIALQDALRHAERLPADATRERLVVELRLHLARSLFALGRCQDVLDLIQQQQAPLENLQDTRLSGRYALLCSQAHSNLGHWQETAQQAQTALDLARSCQDEATTGQAYHVLAMERYWMGQPRQGVAYSQEAIRTLEGTGETYRVGMGHFVLALNALLLGAFDDALKATAAARDIGETIEDARLQTFAAWTAGWIHATRGEWDAGIDACQRALAISSDPLNTTFSMGWLGYAYLEKGLLAEAMPLLEQAAQRLQQYDYRRLEGLYRIFLGEAHRLQGRVDTARTCVLQGEALVRGERYGFGLAWARRIFGRIARDQNDLSAAQDCLQTALTTFTGIQARFETGRTHFDLADVAQRRGDRHAVTLHLTEAYHLFVALRVPVYLDLTAQLARDLGLTLTEPPVDQA